MFSTGAWSDRFLQHRPRRHTRGKVGYRHALYGRPLPGSRDAPIPRDRHTLAARYFGIAEAELVDELHAGKTLSDVAREHGRTREGLIAALVRAA